ncbi:hypothetical protein DWY27_04910 [Clostridium sp. AF24-2LB]|jgi:hypothetical protein|nr:hypothetical protein DWY27_04910 [Clostridium sp. AF24-2LB]
MASREHYIKCKEKGICPKCGKISINGKVYCKSCRSAMKAKRDSEKKTVHRSERPNYGICYICGKEQVIKNKKVCPKCYKQRILSINQCIKSRDGSYKSYWKQSMN